MPLAGLVFIREYEPQCWQIYDDKYLEESIAKVDQDVFTVQEILALSKLQEETLTKKKK